MLSMLRSELFRARRRRQTWISIGIVAIGTMLFYLGFTIAHFFRPDDPSIARTLQVDTVKEEGLIILSLLGGIVAVVFGAGLIGSEYSWNTMRSLVARARTRSALIGAKWLAALIYVVVLVTVTVLVAYVSATVATLVTGADLSWNGNAIGDLVTSILQNTIAIAPYIAVAVFVAVLTRSNAASIAAGIAIVFVEPIFFALLGALSNVFDTIAKAGLSYNASQVTAFRSGSSSETSSGEFVRATLILLAWIAVLAVVSSRLFRTRDVKSG